MASPAILKIDIIADATKAAAALNQTGDAATKAGGKFSGMGKVVAGAVGTAAIVGFGKASFAAAEESAQATARLEQVFASMGDTTGEAAKAATDYASALSQKIAVDDEAIMAAQAQLATFGAVSDETARQAGIFDRATAAAADLAAAGFGTLDSNSVSLGKALQDPTKGMTALSKSGVTFTASQKEQIKALQESGDLLGAQKIVLAAVEGQVKGTAEATATGSDKMAIAFGEVQEQVGGALLPAMTKLTEIFLKYKGIILPVGAAMLVLVGAVKAYELGAKAVKAAQAAWNIVQAAFNIIMGLNPILLVVLAIAALVAGIILAYQKVGWFRDLVDGAFNLIKNVIKGVVDWVTENWPLLLAILTGPFGLAILFITKFKDDILGFVKEIPDKIGGFFSGLFDIIKGPFEKAWDWIVDKFDDLVDFFAELPGRFVEGLVNIFETIKGPFEEAWNWITDKFDSLVDFFAELPGRFVKGLANIFDTIKGPFETAHDWIVDRFDGLVDYFAELPGRFVEGLKNLTGMFKNIFKSAFNGIANIWNDTVGSLSFSIPSWVPGIGGNKFEVPNIPTLATGGMVARTGLAVVHAGEQFSGVGRTFSSGGNVTINVTTTGLGADAPSIQRAVANALRGYTSRNGPLDIPVRGVA